MLGGAPVAVKVRRAGLDNAVRADLSLLDALRPPLRGAFPVAGRRRAAPRRIREQALDELDLEHEAAQQRAVGRALRDVAGVVVPRPTPSWRAAPVLVSGWLDGPTLADHDPADPSAVARALVAAHVTAARGGLVLIDPRPNHVVLLDDGRVGLLGTGNAVAGGSRAALRPAHPARRAARRRPGAVRPRGPRGARPAARRGERRDAHALLRELLGDLVAGPARVDGAALEAVGRVPCAGSRRSSRCSPAARRIRATSGSRAAWPSSPPC